MIIWLNGTFGAGKTTTSAEVARIVPKATVFDSEEAGVMLSHVKRLPRVTDFQHWPPWRNAGRRMNHLPAYEEALPWLRREAREVDTTGIPPRRVASLVASKVVMN